MLNRAPAEPDENLIGGHSRTVVSVQRRTMVVLIITQVIGTIGVGIAPSIGILLASEVTSSETWAGLARTASTLGAAIMGLPLGTLAAKFGRRFALSSGWWTAAVGSLILVAAAQYSLIIPLFIGLLTIGAGSAVSLQARFAATDLSPHHRKGRSLAIIVWFGTLGSVLGPNLGVPGEILSDHTGLTVFAGAFLIAGICLALAGTLVFIWLRPDPLRILQQSIGDSGAATLPRKGRISRIMAELRANYAARYAVIAILTAQVVMVSVMTMTPVHMDQRGDSVKLVGLTISLHIVGMYALAPIVGLIADRLGHRWAIFIGIAVFLVSLAIGAIWPTVTGWLIVSLILLGVGWSFINVAGSALFSAVISNETRASSQGGVDAVANFFGAVAAFAAGPLLAVSSFSTLSVISIVFLMPLTVLTARFRPVPLVSVERHSRR